MSDKGIAPSKATLAAVFAYATLPVDSERLDANCELYSSTLALIRQVSVERLGETVPAVGFKASWD
jgi:hypothetical protein